MPLCVCFLRIPVLAVYISLVYFLCVVKGDNLTTASKYSSVGVTQKPYSDIVNTTTKANLNVHNLTILFDGQNKESKNSNINLAFLPGLAIFILFIVVTFRACKWCRESAKLKERGYSYDLASYVILVQGDKDFHDVDIADNYDTVNSVTSFIRGDSISSYRSLQHRIDAQMYDTVNSYTSYLQNISKDNVEIELQDITSDDNTQQKQTKASKNRDTNQLKLPKDSRFSIKPALDNYMRLKGALSKRPLSPKNVHHDCNDEADNVKRTTSKQSVSIKRTDDIPEPGSTNSREKGRQLNSSGHRLSTTLKPHSSGSVPGLGREDCKRSNYTTAAKVKRSFYPSESNNTKDKILIENMNRRTFCNQHIKMVDAGTQAETSYRKRTRNNTSLSSEFQTESSDPSSSDFENNMDDQNSEESGISHGSNTESPDSTCLEITIKGDLSVIQDCLKDKFLHQPPHIKKGKAFSVCAIVHSNGSNTGEISQTCENRLDENNPNANSGPGKVVKMKNSGDFCPLNKTQLVNKSDTVLIGNANHRSSMEDCDQSHVGKGNGNLETTDCVSCENTFNHVETTKSNHITSNDLEQRNSLQNTNDLKLENVNSFPQNVGPVQG